MKCSGDLATVGLPGPRGQRLAHMPSHITLKGNAMNASQRLRALGQSLWLDNITRALLTSDTLARYSQDLALTGLTSNPTIFEHAISKSDAYDEAISHHVGVGVGESGEALFFELALEDLTRAADRFRAAFDASGGVDGWAPLEVSPLLADDAAKTIAAAARLHVHAARADLFSKIRGTPAGITAIEESIFAGVPINVTLLFSRAHQVAAADAYLRGIERRITARRDPKVALVASLFVSRWDVATHARLPPAWRNRLGMAVAMQTFRAYRERLASPRWRKLAAAGAQAQRLLWASPGIKDPAAPDTLYVEALAAPDTINTLPEKTLAAFADHGQVGHLMPEDGGAADAVLAAQLQRERADAFSKSWHALLGVIRPKGEALTSFTSP